MRKLIKTRHFITLALGLILVSVATTYNACSGVKFSAQSAAPSVGGQGGGLGPDDDNDDLGCIHNCNVVDRSTSKTVPYGTSKLDILIVVDNSASMKKENAELANRIGGLIDTLDNVGASWQMCYTTTHVLWNAQAGEILGWKTGDANSPKVISNTTHNKKTVFQNTMADITLGEGQDGSGAEQGIAATRFALAKAVNSDCFRNDAALSVLYLSDEDEHSCGGRCAGGAEEPEAHWDVNLYTEANFSLVDMNRPAKLVQYVSQKWSKKAFTAHAIVIKPGDKNCWIEQDKEAPAFYGIEYAKLAQLTGGVLGNICASSYSSQLNNIAHRTLESMGAITLDCAPIADPVVTYSPNPGAVSVSRSGKQLFFNPALPSGTTVNISYQCYQ